MMKKSLLLCLCAAVPGAAALPGCGSNNANTPTAVATPAPTPTPTPSPTASPAAQGCNLPAMPECSPRGGGGCCRQEYDELGEYVELSVRQVIAERPELFRDNGIIRNHEAFVSAVAKVLEQKWGLCVKAGDPVEDEVAVKRSNEFSEQFDIIFASGYANVWGYEVTCRPARF